LSAIGFTDWNGLKALLTESLSIFRSIPRVQWLKKLRTRQRSNQGKIETTSSSIFLPVLHHVHELLLA
jgi:hypothetical protein